MQPKIQPTIIASLASILLSLILSSPSALPCSPYVSPSNISIPPSTSPFNSPLLPIRFPLWSQASYPSRFHNDIPLPLPSPLQKKARTCIRRRYLTRLLPISTRSIIQVNIIPSLPDISINPNLKPLPNSIPHIKALHRFSPPSLPRRFSRDGRRVPRMG